MYRGQTVDQSSELCYKNIVKQINEGGREAFTKGEIVHGVLRAIKLGTFTDILLDRDDITIRELRHIQKCFRS